MAKKMEKGLIAYCAPTLAGMKCASLFQYYHDGEEIVRKELAELNQELNPKGVFLEILIWREKSALVYVYRTNMLEAILKQADAIALLADYGYHCNAIAPCLAHLKERIAGSSCFPHEIGVFLGYPLEDVYGFILHGGRNCKSCGVWKVYCNQEEKDRIFQKFQKCSEIYMQVFGRGRALAQMTVSA